MRLFKTKWFSKFTKKQHIHDKQLIAAIKDIQAGKIDADLGGGLIKQRFARQGKGKSGGYRSILVYSQNDKAVFLYGFAKNERDNLSQLEEREYKAFAKIILGFTEDKVDKLVESGAWQEITDDNS